MKEPSLQGKNTVSHSAALNRLLRASVPYMLFLIGLVVVSVGFFRFVENQSVLSMFIVDRGRHVAVTSEIIKWEDSKPTPSTTENQETKIPVQPESPLPAVTEQENTSDVTQRLVVPFFYIGDKIGTLTIPSVNIDVGVYQGDREAEFKLGAGHYAGSYFPGQGNNILIAAHRTTYFKPLETIAVGDLITFATTYGDYNYIVSEILIIDGRDNSVAAETEGEQLTLYTCYPFNYFGNAPNRFVVIARPEGN